MSNINAQVSLISLVPNVTTSIAENNVVVSEIPVLQTGLPNLSNIIDNELDKKAIISGGFILSGAGNISLFVMGNTIIISGH